VGQTLLLHQVHNALSERVLLIGCGSEKEVLKDRSFRDIVRKMISTLNQTGALDALCCITELNVNERDLLWKIRQTVQVIDDALYTFDEFKSKKEKILRPLSKILFMVPNRRDLISAQRAIVEGQAIAHSVQFTKNLGNFPPNVCTPSFLAKEAKTLATKFSSISTAVLDEKDITALKMGSFLAVAKGSQNPPKLITLEYRGRKDKQKPIVLVGKGITFDTGGNSLKSPGAMIGMKYDMCGAATVLGALRFAAEMELPLNIVGVIPCAENMPGSTATRPDDIVTSMSGTTIEILNTDAEGRLILCDALTYCERFDPDVVIDIATLTGACVMTFGTHVSGLLSNNEALASDLLKAGLISGDRCWQLPLYEEYQEALSSSFADLANIGTPPEAGTILGACFLSRFTQKYHWAHLDVAGTAARGTGKDRGATGRPVPLITQYLLDRCHK
jgi:leucyl aminopeptidase